MNKEFIFSTKEKVLFYLSYIYYRLLIPFEIKKGAINIIFAEILWVLGNITKTRKNITLKLFPSYLETIHGKFFITPDIFSSITSSTAFERRDINYLKKLMEKYSHKKCLFLDIGSNFGLYTILVGLKFKRMDILSFEPGTEYISLPAFELLKKNVSHNKLKRVKLFELGVGAKNGKNQDGIKIKTLDSIIGKKYFSRYDVVFIKLDIDDYVIDGLNGIQECVNNGKEVYLFVEDFVKRKQVLKYLNNSEFKFLGKYTSYNSFWLFKK